MKSQNQNVSVWFPDAEILRKIREEAKRTERGIGYVICKYLRKYFELIEKNKGE